MRLNTLKTKLGNNQPVYGMLTPVYDPTVVELVGHLGFDCYMLDCEHGAGGPLQAEHFVRACETVGLTPLARVRSTDPKLLLQFMDAGIMGVMMPGVMDADDVRRLVEGVKYPPLGKRGIAPVRANDYLLGPMAQEEYITVSNEQTMVLPQIETMEAVKNLDSLLKVEGVDGFIVGPRDLSMSMGFRDGPAHPEVRSLVTEIFQTVTAAGLMVGTVAGTAEEAADIIERGGRIILGSVQGLLKLGAASFLAKKV
ncbi:MAG TPA: aldolase/citrate lyase family protein [Chloroflexia bacterium]|nr:aldolase/citrate lyase family protein [Chloroflexia bacterium]